VTVSLAAHDFAAPFLAGAQGANATAKSLREFAAAVNPRYRWYRHCAVLADALQRVADGKIRRLMVFMPPRHGKSELVSRIFPAYYLRRHPHRWVGLCSYEATLAQDFSRTARDAFLRDGGTIRDDSSAVSLWQTPDRGGMWAAGVGGPITGKGFHLGIIDDPIKNDEEAQSETIRAKQKSWFQSTFATREAPDEEAPAIVVVQTRWHEDDLSGWLLAQEQYEAEGWHVVNFEAVKAESTAPFPMSCTVEPDWRAAGQPLCPERYDATALEKIKRRVGSYFWSALYQQAPAEAGGQVFKRDWWRYYTADTLPRTFDWVVQSWDLPFKDTDGSDYAAGQVWGRVGARFYLLDRVRERMSFTAACQAIKAMAAKWPKATGVYVEDAANGPAVVNALVREVPGLIAVRPEGGKVSRAYAAQPLVEAGQVFLPDPRLASWVEDFVREHAAFPTGAHDDEVDAFTQAMAQITWGAVEPPEPVKGLPADVFPGIDVATRQRKRSPSAADVLLASQVRKPAHAMPRSAFRMPRGR
jgi:predicted phage terminase large subunit-like protein